MKTRIKITSDMSENDLWALRKNAKRGQNKFKLRCDDQRYPTREHSIKDLPFLVGINGEIQFCKS